MYKLAFLFCALITLNASAQINNDSKDFNREESELEKILFGNTEGSRFQSIEINSIEIIELEEEVEFCFDTANYLPKDFNALEGLNNLDLASAELIEIEKELHLNLVRKSTIQ